MTVIDPAVRSASPTTAATLSPWKYFRRVFNAAVTTAFAFVAALVMVLSFATHQVSTGDYQAFGHPVMAMLSGSMSPELPTGSLVVDNALSPAQAQNLHVGQIISFRIAANSPVVITHRIVRVVHDANGVSYVTKGDANSSVDSPARPAANVFGVYSASVPQAGYLLNTVHRPAFIIMLLLIVLFGLSTGPLVRWVRRGEKSTAPTREVTA